MNEEMPLAWLGPGTHDVYIDALRRLAADHLRSSYQLREEDVRTYFLGQRNRGPSFRDPLTPIHEDIRLRVLIIQLSVGFSGTEKHAVELANGLSPHLDVAVLLRPKPAAPERHAEYDALRDAINSNIPVYLSSRGMLPFGLWNAIRRFRPDLIHAHYEGSARMAARWARPLGIPLIATIHTQYRHRSFGACDALIALTENERQRTRLFYHKEIALIENWVNCKAKPGPNRVVSLRTEFGIKNNSFVVGSVGRLEPIKRTKGIIHAYPVKSDNYHR